MPHYPHKATLVLSLIVATSSVASASAYTFSSIDVPGASWGTIAYDLNDRGQIVGLYQDATGVHSFILSGGSFTSFDFPGALYITGATGINNAGQIVGSYQAQPPVGSSAL